MKKLLTVLLAVGLTACLFSSCKNNSASGEPSSSDAEIQLSTASPATVTTSLQNSVKQGTDTLIKCDPSGLEIKLPDSWKDRYLYSDSKADGDVFSYTFYSKSNYDSEHHGGGILFYFYAQTSEKASGSENASIIGQNDQYVFFVGHATDVEYAENDENKKKEYQEMSGDVQGILSDFITRNHITAFSTSDTATEKISGYDVKILYSDPRVSKEIQNKANKAAVSCLSALYKKDWNAFKAVSTGEFYNSLKAFDESGGSDPGSGSFGSKALIGASSQSIGLSYYLQKGANPSVFIDLTNGICEIKLTKDSSGNFLVSGINY